MNAVPTLPAILQRFFTERLMTQRQVSAHTMASYRDTFRLLLSFAEGQRHKHPSELDLVDLDAVLISAFLTSLEKQRHCTARTRNARLTAIRSFFQYAAFQEPALSAHIQRILAIPYKRQARPMVEFLSHAEIEALLAVPDRSTWVGRRDHALLVLAVQTGLRLSELTSLSRTAVAFGPGAHVRCRGKGRKERCTPLTRLTAELLKAWLKESTAQGTEILFPNRYGARLSADSVQYLVKKYVRAASTHCPSLKGKRVSPHVLRHSAAMELLAADVDSSVIALWLGHESVNTTQIYLHAHLALKEAALAKTTPFQVKPGRYRPADRLLQFLTAL
jgi:integrase/recombinase XerD